MKTYWEGTVKHYFTDENGKLKKVNSVYLVDAVNHTEVEAILTVKMSQIVTGEFEIKPIRQSDVVRVINGEPTGRYFKVKIEMEFEKKETEVILVEANDLESALNGFLANEKILGYDFEVLSVSKSKILDVYEPSIEYAEEEDVFPTYFAINTDEAP